MMIFTQIQLIPIIHAFCIISSCELYLSKNWFCWRQNSEQMIIADDKRRGSEENRIEYIKEN